MEWGKRYDKGPLAPMTSRGKNFAVAVESHQRYSAFGSNSCCHVHLMLTCTVASLYDTGTRGMFLFLFLFSLPLLLQAHFETRTCQRPDANEERRTPFNTRFLAGFYLQLVFGICYLLLLAPSERKPIQDTRRCTPILLPWYEIFSG